MRCTCVAAMIWLCAGVVVAQEAKSVGVSPEEAKEGFVSAFDGKTMDGWVGDVKNYAVEDGVMICHGGNVFLAKEYANFILRFEFKVPSGGNNGVGIRAPLQGAAAYDGIELQILDDDHPMYKDLHDYQYHGSVYGVVPAKRGAPKPAGEWNTEEVVADGGHIKVTVNGKVIVDADISKIEQGADGSVHPGLHNAKGYVGWLGHGNPPDAVSFRNIRIKELP